MPELRLLKITNISQEKTKQNNKPVRFQHQGLVMGACVWPLVAGDTWQLGKTLRNICYQERSHQEGYGHGSRGTTTYTETTSSRKPQSQCHGPSCGLGCFNLRCSSYMFLPFPIHLYACPPLLNSFPFNLCLPTSSSLLDS